MGGPNRETRLIEGIPPSGWRVIGRFWDIRVGDRIFRSGPDVQISLIAMVSFSLALRGQWRSVATREPAWRCCAVAMTRASGSLRAECRARRAAVDHRDGGGQGFHVEGNAVDETANHRDFGCALPQRSTRVSASAEAGVR